MKQLLYALVALGVLLLGFSAVFLLAPSSPVKTAGEPADAAPGSPEELPGGGAGDDAAAAELVAPDAPAEPAAAGEAELRAPELPAKNARAVVGARPHARPVGVWADSERVVVRGRVALPSGVEPDPTLTVIALKEDLEPREIYGRFGVLSRLAREDLGIDAAAEDHRALARVEAEEGSGGGVERVVRVRLEPPPEEGSEGDAEGAEDEDVEPHHHLEIDGLVALAPVAADGSFEVPFPAGEEEGWLAVDGRYLYSEAARRVELPSREAVALQPAVGGWLTGEVRVPDDVEDREAVFRDLRVTLEFDPQQFNFFGMNLERPFDRLAVPDGAGRFEFRGVPTDPPYIVKAESDHLADATESGVELGDARDRHVVLELLHGARVAGRVVDEEGEPVAEARVRAATGWLFGMATNRVGRAETDAEGYFEFEHLPPGKVQLTARLDGYLDSRPENVELEDRGEHEGALLQLSRGASVGGRLLLPDGEPAAGVEVELDFDPDALAGMSAFNAARGAEGEAETDADGRFLITGLGRGPFVVAAELEIDGVGHAVRKSPVQPGDLDLELRLSPDPVLRGRVVDLDGAPLPEFTVRAEIESHAFWMGGERVERSFEDPEGAFVLEGLRAGPWRVRARAPGFAPSPWAPVELPAAEGDPPLELALAPEAVAAGVVLDPEGRPVAGATVHQQLEMMAAFANASGLDEAEAARTDEEGKFALGGLPEGAVSLVASHPDFVDSAEVPVELAAGQTADDVVLRLRRGGTVVGEIFDQDGEPAGGVMVVLQDTQTFIPTTFRSDSDGTFRREGVKPGKLQITAMLSDPDAANFFADEEPDFLDLIGNMRTDVLTVVEGETTEVVLGAPPSDPVNLSGVISHGGEPVSSAVLTLYPEGGEGLGSMQFTTSDDEGRYEIVLDKPGNYLMQVQMVGDSAMKQDSLEFPQAVPEAEEHVIDVELPAGRLTGRVIGRDGEPAAGARVTVTVDGGVGYGSFLGGRYVETVTDEDGRYAIDYLPAGTYSVAAGGNLAGGMFGGGAAGGRTIVSGVRVEEGETVGGIDFRLEQPGEIKGRVVDMAGAPVSGASVFVRDEQGRVLERFSMISTDGAGRFRYTGLAPGRYTVSARTVDLASFESDPITVPPGGVGETRIAVEAGTQLNVTVVDKQGDLVKAKVLVQDSEGRQVNGMVSYQDIVSSSSAMYTTDVHQMGPLAPGSYEVTAVADDGRSVTKPVTLSGQAERRLKIRLR